MERLPSDPNVDRALRSEIFHRTPMFVAKSYSGGAVLSISIAHTRAIDCLTWNSHSYVATT
jgi:hypothetical protein